MSRFNKGFIALLIAFCIGAQWPVLQSVAWLNMIVSYTKESGLSEGISKTFDGKHPCKLCKFVSEGKSAEKKKSQGQSVKKFDLFLATTPNVIIGRVVFLDHPPFAAAVRLRASDPPSPPPDFLA